MTSDAAQTIPNNELDVSSDTEVSVNDDPDRSPKFGVLAQSRSTLRECPELLELQRGREEEERRRDEAAKADAASPITAGIAAMFRGGAHVEDAGVGAGAATCSAETIPGLALTLAEDEEDVASCRGGSTPTASPAGASVLAGEEDDDDGRDGGATPAGFEGGIRLGDEEDEGSAGVLAGASLDSARTPPWPRQGQHQQVTDEPGQNVPSGSPTAFSFPVAFPGVSPKPPWRWHPSKRRLGEDDSDPKWLARRKHFFILSDAGKPIYSRYGDESALAGFTAALSAIVAAAEDPGGGGDQGDKLHCVSAGANHKMVFLTRGPVYLVALAATGEPVMVLRRQLELLHSQLISILTVAVERALKKSSRFDMRNLLGGVDAVFGTLAHGFTWDPACLLGAWLPLPFPSAMRRKITGALQVAAAGPMGPGAHAALLLTRQHVVAVATPRRATTMHPDDVIILANFVRASESFRNNPESFSPVCLPQFNAGAFVYAYVAFLEPGVCLVLVSTQNDSFHALAEARVGVEEALRVDGLLDKVVAKVGVAWDSPVLKTAAVSPSLGPSSSVGQQKRGDSDGDNKHNLGEASETGTGGGNGSWRGADNAAEGAGTRRGSHSGERNHGSVSIARHVPRGAGGGTVGQTSLLHFLYVRPPLAQYTAPDWAPPLAHRREQKRLLRAYQRIHAAMRRSPASDWESPPFGGSNRNGGGGSNFSSFFGMGGSSGGSSASASQQRVHYEAGDDHVLLACIGADFELYVAFDPLTQCAAAAAVCNRLCTWLRQEEAQLFVLPT